jgi:micrococcal nuclease
VTKIVDGDTIDVQIGDQEFRVRYIGIDTPEQNEAFFGEAFAYNRKLIENKTVTLVKDESETDNFGRLLRYVVLGDTFVNYELVKSGYAAASAYAPDVACSTDFEVAQGQAQVASLGRWIAPAGTFIAPVTGGETESSCDPSYPGVCIPPGPPDLDCKDIPYKRFTVLPPDPHSFDRDGDGVGCES